MRRLAGLMLRIHFVIQSEINTSGSRGPLRLTVLYSTNKQKESGCGSIPLWWSERQAC